MKLADVFEVVTTEEYRPLPQRPIANSHLIGGPG
jgi:hypothetical protein